MKVLHLSFHNGCQNDIQYICNKLNIELTSNVFHDGISIGNDQYNITHDKAENAWKLYKDFYEQFDCIITSDTAPISRVFLQNNWKKKLIIWICNRFDYSHQPCDNFPDKEYYDLINDVKNRDNIYIIGYTPFENVYANIYKKLSIGYEIIKPIGKIISYDFNSTIVNNKLQTFLIGPYHNDNIMMDLKKKIESLEINVYNGRYNGPLDLVEFAGIIHIPYAWSNLALFEAIQLDIIYLIPSLCFLKELSKEENFWYQDMQYFNDNIHLSEWYCSEHKDLFIYFDSWKDLKFKIDNTNFKLKKKFIKNHALYHENLMLLKWENILF